MGLRDVISPEALASIESKAASDPAFRARLLSAPHEALAGVGIRLSEGVSVRFVEDTAGTRHFVLPPLPGGELVDQDLDKVAGGMSHQQLGGAQLGGMQQLGGAQQLGGGFAGPNKQLGHG